MHSFCKMICHLIHTLELDCTSHSSIQYTRSTVQTQAAVIYEIINGLQLQSVTHLSW